MDNIRLGKEQSFHDNRFGGDDPRFQAKKYYSANKGIRERYFEIIANYCRGKKLLELGCGTGNSIEKWLNLGAQLTGIDISPTGIEKAKERAFHLGLTADFLVMDAENIDFGDNSFDIIVGNSIIHHLDLDKSYKEINRILSTYGHAIFAEPLGHNPIINLYRYFTPQMRTGYEHPLKNKDLKLLGKFFGNVHLEYFSFFTLLAVPFRNVSLFDPIYKFLSYIDNAVFQIPFLRKYAWAVLIHVSRPLK